MTATVMIIMAVLLMLLGLVGVFLPILPGIPFMFVIALAYSLITKFQILTPVELGWLGGLTVISIVVDYLSGVLGAKFGGASGKSLLVGLIGFLIGLVLFPPFGGFVGMFLGIAIAEIYFWKHISTALRAASGGVVGSLVGMLVNLLIGLVLLVLFVVCALSRS